MIKKCFFSALLGLLFYTGYSQVMPSVPVKTQSYQDSLLFYAKKITQDSLEADRLKANYSFIRTLVKSLNTTNSYNYQFDSLQSKISIKESPDRKFRIFSWFVMGDDGSFRYYGTIQLNNLQKLQLIPLFDNTAKITNPETDKLAANNWFGAVYYQIIPVTNVKEPYYTLLGWKGKSYKSTQKVIETLQIKDDKAIFGLPVFELSKKDTIQKKRIVFEYTSEVSMLLKYNSSEKIIVHDHLVNGSKSEPNNINHEFYGPDATYDGFKLKNYKWHLVENLNLKNMPDLLDEAFIDPTKITETGEPIRKY